MRKKRNIFYVKSKKERNLFIFYISSFFLFIEKQLYALLPEFLFL